jgi:S-adenosylmethionine:tRNA ribosyltransferase-isomerase
MQPQQLTIQDYTYTLPDEKIAYFPLAARDASKLLVYQQGQITETVFTTIDTYLPEHALLVFNNTKVVAARLLFQKASGGVIEIFCLEPHGVNLDITTAMLQQGQVQWQCLVGGASKWKPGVVLEKVIDIGHTTITLQATLSGKTEGGFIIQFNWTPVHLSFAEVLHAAGVMPLPPYIKRKADNTDDTRYQTVYAKEEGSVAAPTAGLHFTDAVIKSIQARHITPAYLTLHVGAGTFKPVKAATMEAHDMHAEWIDVSRDFIEQLATHPDQVVAVGTTSMRTLETLYWLGVKCLRDSNFDLTGQVHLSQWECYNLPQQFTTKEALEALAIMLAQQNLSRLMATTQIIITPGYTPRVVHALVTNFHQPQSTLLLLVAACIGDDWRKVYDYALTHQFRFLSYGDSSLLLFN